tara:strand:- start:93 stop:437 length:345 start_codon:yes stop_codon:yes gene_type:complete
MKKIITIAILMLFSTATFSQDHVEIPNIFTPNQDGINDFFQIRTEGYSTLKCTIFNRQGGVVYVFYGLNGSWDGHSHAGMECTDGTYFVILELGIEGGESKTFQGDLQLIRNQQ